MLYGFFILRNKFYRKVYCAFPHLSSYGHTTVKAPHPIRTAKLSTVGLVQYFGRGLRGNNQCCMAFLFFLEQHGGCSAGTVLVLQGYWRNRKRACLASTRYWDRNPDTPVRYGVVGNISACHADARGSIPRFGVLFFFDKNKKSKRRQTRHARRSPL